MFQVSLPIISSTFLPLPLSQNSVLQRFGSAVYRLDLDRKRTRRLINYRGRYPLRIKAAPPQRGQCNMPRQPRQHGWGLSREHLDTTFRVLATPPKAYQMHSFFKKRGTRFYAFRKLRKEGGSVRRNWALFLALTDGFIPSCSGRSLISATGKPSLQRAS